MNGPFSGPADPQGTAAPAVGVGGDASPVPADLTSPAASPSADPVAAPPVKGNKGKGNGNDKPDKPGKGNGG